MAPNLEKMEQMYQLLIKLDNTEDCQILLEDLCTRKEMKKMADRVYAAKLLKEE